MNLASRNGSRRPARFLAFTLIELAVVIAAIAVVAGLVLPWVAKSKRKAHQITCNGYLKNVGLAFRIFANDNGREFPAQVPTSQGGAQGLSNSGQVFRHFLAMSNELSTPLILTCPADTRKPVRSWKSLSDANISYFVSLNANEDEMWARRLLTGDRNLSSDGAAVKAGLLELTTNSVVGLSEELHGHWGNFVLGDGSVQQISDARMQEQIRFQGVATNRLLIP